MRNATSRKKTDSSAKRLYVRAKLLLSQFSARNPGTSRAFSIRRSMFIGAILTGLALIAAGAQFAPAAQIKVMTYNIHQTVGQNAGYSSTNAQKVARMVDYYQPDVLTINELEGSNTTLVTNNLLSWCSTYLPYLGGQPGVTYFYYVSPTSDGYNRNAIISRYPINDTVSYSLPPRDLLCGTVAIPNTPGLRVFAAHFKASTACSTRQSNANNTKLRIINWSGSIANSAIPYVMCGDLNEDEDNPTCTITESYHPITTVREAYLNDYMPDSGWGNTKSWSSTSTPTKRFDYILPSWHLKARPAGAPSIIDNSIICDTNAWFSHGVLPSGLSRFDSQGSDHLCVLATFDTAADSTISDIRETADNSPVFSELQTVTASFSDHFYIEDEDRLHGIRVNSTVNPGLGALVTIQGTWHTSAIDEDAVNATGVRGFGMAPEIPEPWTLKNRDINSEPYQTTGVPGASGPCNAGLLVKTWGEVLSVPVPAGGIFYIDDGGHYPVRVSSTKSVYAGDFVTVVGVVGFHISAGVPERFLETRTTDDVQIVQ